MLSRHISRGIKLHVYTEADRPVPEPFIKHTLIDWGIGGPKQSWWYKMQLFNSEHHKGPLLYFDLDTVIVDNIDWVWHQPLNYFWTVQDFKYLWRPEDCGVNSSIMWWNTEKFDYVWQEFIKKDLTQIRLQWRGDQDYITDAIPSPICRFFNSEQVKSWRWECLDNGYDFKHRIYKSPKSGTILTKNTSILVFHGSPKPDQITDPVVAQHWR
jgi:hypothetical protein